MRSSSVFGGLLAVLTTANALPSSSEIVSTSLVPSDDPHGAVNGTESETNDLERRQPPPPNPDFLWLAINVVGYAVAPEAMGLANLVGSTWNAVGRCIVNPLSFDCLFGAVDAVFNVWNSDFFGENGFRKRSTTESGHPIIALRQNNSTAGPSLVTSVAAHIEIQPNEPLMRAASLRGGLNGTWVRIATTYINDTEAHHLHHRLALAEDLGFENDGRYHHFRATPAPAMLRRLGVRAEDNDNGVVVDYLWKDGNSANWNQIHGDKIANNGNELGSNTANWMERNNAEATCASVGSLVTVSEGSDFYETEDQGVVAYGWNNQPFGFNGRAGHWVDSCRP